MTQNYAYFMFQEDKRAQIEAKVDEAAKKEREEVKKEKQQLIRDRRFKLTEIKRLEFKRIRISEVCFRSFKSVY